MSDADKEPWLNIYGQFIYHGDATLRGNRAALTALRDGIDAALNEGQATVQVFASDGEGFGLRVQRVNTMAALGSPEYIYEREFRLGWAAAERDREFRLRRKHKTEPAA